jgi:predicted NBD/HSP70 family sugar kinase
VLEDRFEDMEDASSYDDTAQVVDEGLHWVAPRKHRVAVATVGVGVGVAVDGRGGRGVAWRGARAWAWALQ